MTSRIPWARKSVELPECQGLTFQCGRRRVSDDTAAIQKALDAAGQQGGGTVYLPQGQYRVTRLTVPTGVELRGPLGGGVHNP